MACKQVEESEDEVKDWKSVVLPIENENGSPSDDLVTTDSPLLGCSEDCGKADMVDVGYLSSVTVTQESPKKAKSGEKQVSDAIKTDMAAERTFFKWLWAGLHTGAIGSLIVVKFGTDKEDPYRLPVLTFAWVIAFALVLFGLFGYNRRRRALHEGRMDMLPESARGWGPYVVVSALALVVGTSLLHAIFTRGNIS